MSLGEKILKLRKQKGLSQEELGDRIKVTRQTISNWELNETSPNPEQLKSLSRELNISIDELLDNDVKDVLVEKVSNTEKLSKTVLSLLKIMLYFIIGIVILWIVLIVGRIIVKNTTDRGREIEESIHCKLYGEQHSYEVTYYELTGEIAGAGGDSYFDDILNLGKYDDAHQIFNVINDYVKKNGGTCFRTYSHELNDVVSMYIKEGTLTNKGATIVIEENNDDLDINYGEPFTLEKYNYSDNTWEEMPIICDNCAFNLPAYSVTPEKPLELYQDWSRLYGELSKGEYRIVKEADIVSALDRYKIWTEFTID